MRARVEKRSVLGWNKSHECRLCTKKKIDQKDKSLRHGVGAQCRVISRFVHPSAPIQTKYINRTNYHKMGLVVLIRDSVKVVRRGATEVPIFFFSHPDFDGGEFYAAKRYIYAVQEGSEDYMFDVPVPSVRRARQSVSARVNE